MTFIMVLRRVQTPRIFFTIKTVILVTRKQSPYLIAEKYCFWIKSCCVYDYNPHNKGFQLRFSGKHFRTKN